MHINELLKDISHEENERDLFLKCDWAFVDKEAAQAALKSFGLHKARNHGLMNTRLMLIAYAIKYFTTGRFIAYSRNPKRYIRMQRYYGPDYNFRKITEEIDKLEDKGLIDHDLQMPGSHLKSDPRQSSFRATQKLYDALKHLKCTFVLHDVIRKRALFDRQTNRKSFRKHPGRKYVSRLVDYPDDDLTNGYRDEIRHINEFLATIKLQWPGMENKRIGHYNSFDAKATLETPLFITRSFCRDKFALYGRCHGFWQNVPKTLRPRIILNGEKTCEPDFSQCHLNLAYLSKLLDPPADAYTIEGYDRKQIKTAVPILLNTSSERSAVGALAHAFEIRDDDAQLMIDHIKQKHPKIVDTFHTDMGVRFMFVESCILIEAMHMLVIENIPFLPVHDSLRVPVSQTDKVICIMQQAFRSRYPSFTAPIKVKDA